jgi:hypothetical protein
VAQVIELLPSKIEALSLTHSTTRDKGKKVSPFSKVEGVGAEMLTRLSDFTILHLPLSWP